MLHVRRLRDENGAADVHVDHVVEHLRRHVVEGLVAQDAGVVHDDVDLAELVEGLVHDGRAAVRGGHRGGVGDGDAAGGGDLLRHGVGRLVARRRRSPTRRCR